MQIIEEIVSELKENRSINKKRQKYANCNCDLCQVDKLSKNVIKTKEVGNHQVWQFIALKTIEDKIGLEGLIKLAELKPWKVLEYKVFKVLLKSNVMFRPCVSTPSLKDVLKSHDFTVYSSRKILYNFECKWVDKPKCVNEEGIRKYCENTLKGWNRPDALYVTNDEFYSLLKIHSFNIQGKVIRVSDIGDLLSK